MKNWHRENETPKGPGNSLTSGKSAAGKRKVFVHEIREAATEIPLVTAQMEERNTLPILCKEASREEDGKRKFRADICDTA